MNSNELNKYGDILLPKDLQAILHVSRATLYKILAEGTIKSIKIGNSYRIPKQYLIDFLFSNASKEERNLNE